MGEHNPQLLNENPEMCCLQDKYLRNANKDHASLGLPTREALLRHCLMQSSCTPTTKGDCRAAADGAQADLSRVIFSTLSN